MDNRQADASMNGYFYQRYNCILTILENIDCEYETEIIEEGYEDIDLIKYNNMRDIIQIKYLNVNNDNDSSIVAGSGLFKVIVSANNINNVTNIDNIIYKVYNAKGKYFNDKVKKLFDEKKYSLLGKYVILVISKSILNNYHININNISDAYNIYEQNINAINDYICNENNKNKYIYDFFKDDSNCILYFSKFKFEKALSYEELIKAIDQKIANKYANFTNSDDINYSNIKINIIKNTLLNKLTDKMFKNNNMHTRKIQYSEILNEINDNINTLTNAQNLYSELLKSEAKKLNNTIINMPNNSNIIPVLINSIYINKDLELININFYMDFIKKYYIKINFNETYIQNIQLYILNFIKKNIPSNTNITNFKKICNYMHFISCASNKIKHLPTAAQLFNILNIQNTAILYF